MEGYYSTEPGVNPDDIHTIMLAPTGMAAYINGNMIHSGFHIDINKKELMLLNHSESNTLQTKYCKLQFILYDEASLIGQDLFTKSDKRLQVIMGTKKIFGGLHIIVIGDFYQLPPVMDSYIFKGNPYNYGPLATNLWITFFQIFFIERNCVAIWWSPVLWDFQWLQIGEITKDDQTVLKTCIINKADSCYVARVWHFFPLCRTCVKHNELLYRNATIGKIIIHSCDSVTGSTSKQAKAKQLLLVRTSGKYADKDGLLWE